MKILGKGLTRRGLIKRLAIAVSVAPVVKLTSSVARAEKHRRHHAGSKPDEFWIGHC